MRHSAVSVCLTLALHAAVLASALVSCTPGSQEQKAKPQKPPKPLTVGIVNGVPDMRGTWACERRYDGIGLGGMDGSPVWMVTKGGPAWQAGIREGDVLLGIDVFRPNVHPVGYKLLVVKVLPDGTHLPVVIIVDEVCQN